MKTLIQFKILNLVQCKDEKRNVAENNAKAQEPIIGHIQYWWKLDVRAI